MIVHSLNSIGDSISENEQLDIFIEGLPDKCESFISLINGQPYLFSFGEIESLLVAQAKIEKFKQSGDNFSLNLTQVNSQTTSAPTVQLAQTQSNSYQTYSPDTFHKGGHVHRG